MHMDEPLNLFFCRAAFPAPSDSPHTMFQLLSHPYSPSPDSLQSVRASPVPELGREEPPPPSTCWQCSPGGCWPRCWLLVNLLPSRSAVAFSAELCRQQVPSPSWYMGLLLPRGRTLHFPVLGSPKPPTSPFLQLLRIPLSGSTTICY